ncbi:MICOS complex subunit MIC10-like [Homalodisca vitripennis]|uniref:MICOS complex subunit MIC10-like n=1 Tax=Homalodisca vitripennis TaxID=197043 RepID=UPI001EEA6921|nr:MICOS complex subunit MIC10-like [Homalodisca vitripennis]KAG8265858.1 MICOS complex subunit MIC10 [Homalodisca vitripennis]
MPSAGDELNRKWERCRLDAMMKAGGGLLLGSLGSLLLARLRVWPLIFGTGLGLGLAYINCEQDVNKVLAKK